MQFCIFLYRVNATSSHLHGFILFAQTISVPQLSRQIGNYLGNVNNYGGEIAAKTILSSSLWNLDP